MTHLPPLTLLTNKPKKKFEHTKLIFDIILINKKIETFIGDGMVSEAAVYMF